MTITFLAWSSYPKVTPDPVSHAFYQWNIWNRDTLNYPGGYLISAAGKWKCGNFDKYKKCTFLRSMKFVCEWSEKLQISSWSKLCCQVEGRPNDGTHISFPHRIQKLGCMTPLFTALHPGAGNKFSNNGNVTIFSQKFNFAGLCSRNIHCQLKKRMSLPFFSPLALSLP